MNERQQGQSFKKLPRQQKVAVVSLSIVAVGILGVWIWQFNSRINDPFRLSDQEIAAGKKAAQEKIVADAANKIKDSDSDGITDYDETNVYKTSPYLEDTDGDGISDSEEVRLGKDPLCAEGTNCTMTVQSSSSTAGTVATSTTDNTVDGVDQALLSKALSGEGNADTMRQILLQGGGDPEQVKLLSDEELMTMYQEILKETQSSTTTSVATTTTNK